MFISANRFSVPRFSASQSPDQKKPDEKKTGSQSSDKNSTNASSSSRFDPNRTVQSDEYYRSLDKDHEKVYGPATGVDWMDELSKKKQ
jgi:hypothetical protein